MKTELQQEAERRLGTEILPCEWARAEPYAKRKLAGIIDREGDADGVRRESWYLAQLIAETVRTDRFSNCTMFLMEQKLATRDKKRTARDKREPPINQSYCSTEISGLQ